MAFAQPSGPQASAARIAELSDLLAQHGFDSFREARHRFGLTQRQANGKFTNAEIDEVIERVERGDGDEPAEHSAPSDVKGARRHSAAEELVATFSDELLADELTRRGWCCIAPVNGE